MPHNHDPEQTPPSRRSIRSFVIRAGRATAAQERALRELWPLYGVELSGEPIDLDSLFGRKAPRMVEIGFGAGEALLAFAQAHPEFDCIGVEVHPPGVGRLMIEADRVGLKNLRIIQHDAVEALARALPAGSVSLVHIFFPDPWPKKRHHKRRLIQPDFVQLLARVLTPGATLRLATDWEPYALHMRETIDASPCFENAAGEQGFVDRAEERPLTRFEQRGRRLGHDVWDLCYRRTDAPS